MSLVTVAGRVGGVFGTHPRRGGFRRLHPPYRHLPLANNPLPMTNDQGKMTVNVRHLRRHRPGGEDETKAGRRLELLFFRSAQNVRGGGEQQTCRPVGEGRVRNKFLPAKVLDDWLKRWISPSHGLDAQATGNHRLLLMQWRNRISPGIAN